MAIFTFAFDTLFLFQHYVLYPRPDSSAEAKKVVEEEEEEEAVDERTPLV